MNLQTQQQLEAYKHSQKVTAESMAWRIPLGVIGFVVFWKLIGKVLKA